MSVQKLPSEVLEHIFSYLDGRTFATCSQVCCLWRTIRDDMLRIKDWWKVFCYREIPKVTLQEFCGDNSVYSKAVRHSLLICVDWKIIYQKWFTCRRTSCQGYVIKKASVETAPVTCCKLSGSWVLTGHRDGSLCAWDMNDGDVIRIVTQHSRMVTDFVLVDLLRVGPYSGTFHESTCSHQFAVSVSKDHKIQVSSLLEASYGIFFGSQVIQKHSDSLESIRLFGDRFAVLCANNTISVWLLVPKDNPHDLPKVGLLHFLNGPEEQAAWISFWNNQIGCLCKSGIFKTYDLGTETWGMPLHPEAIRVEDSDQEAFGENYGLMISSAHLFWNTAIFLLTADYYLFVSTSGSEYTVFPIMQKFHSYVLSLCFCGPLLALGLENGLLVLFHVDDPLQLAKCGLQEPIWQKKLSPASIIAVDIMLKERGPLILAATTHSWITVNWSDIEAT